MKTNTSPKLQEWIGWIEEIKEFTHRVMTSRDIFKEYMAIVEANPKIQTPGDFHRWVFINYGESIASKIRSQLDPSGITIRKLLKDIQKHPDVITRAWYTSLYSPLDLGEVSINFGDTDFDKVAGKGDSFDITIAQADESHLVALGADIKKFVDKRIAHYLIQEKNVKDIKIKEIDGFIDKYEEIVKKYILLLTATGYSSMTPVWQYDWQKIFNYPWIENSAKNE